MFEIVIAEYRSIDAIRHNNAKRHHVRTHAATLHEFNGCRGDQAAPPAHALTIWMNDTGLVAYLPTTFGMILSRLKWPACSHGAIAPHKSAFAPKRMAALRVNL